MAKTFNYKPLVDAGCTMLPTPKKVYVPGTDFWKGYYLESVKPTAVFTWKGLLIYFYKKSGYWNAIEATTTIRVQDSDKDAQSLIDRMATKFVENKDRDMSYTMRQARGLFIEQYQKALPDEVLITLSLL